MKLIILTAPSGAGKTTIASHILALMPQLRFSISATTRQPRPGEVDGVDYFFLSTEEFKQKIAAGNFLEYKEVYPDIFYGRLKAEVLSPNNSAGVVLSLDVTGAQEYKERFKDKALAIFISPPSLDILAERLKNRHTEGSEGLRVRLNRAKEEMKLASLFDVEIINDDLDTAVAETLVAIKAFLSHL